MAARGFTCPVKIGPGDSFAGFDCGESAINSWARRYAHKARAQGTAVVYVSHAVEDDDATATNDVAGFYTLSTHSIVRSSVASGWLKRNTPPSIPVLLLGMLGVDGRYQGNGLGASLLSDAITRALAVAQSIGVREIKKKKISEKAVAFYLRYGFAPVPGTSYFYLSLVLPANQQND